MAENITWEDKTDATTPTGATSEAQASTYNTLKSHANVPVQKLAAFTDTDVIVDGSKNYSTVKAITAATHTITINSTLSNHKQGNCIDVRYSFSQDCTLTINNRDSSGSVTGTITPIPAGTYDLYFFAGAYGVKVFIPANGGTSTPATQLTALTLGVTTPAAGQVTVAFTNPNSSNETQNQLYYKLNTEPTTWTTGVTAVTGATTFPAQTGLTDGLLYNFKAVAEGDGVTYSDSVDSNVVNETPGAASFSLTTVSFVSSNHAVIDVVANDQLWGDNTQSSPVDIADFAIKNLSSTNITTVSIARIKTTSGTALSGGETEVRLYIHYNGRPDGADTFNFGAVTTSIYDSGGTAMDAAESSDQITLPNTNVLLAEEFTTLDTDLWINDDTGPTFQTKAIESGDFEITQILNGITGFPFNLTDSVLPLYGDIYIAFNCFQENNHWEKFPKFLGCCDYGNNATQTASAYNDGFSLNRDATAGTPYRSEVKVGGSLTAQGDISALPPKNQYNSFKITRVGNVHSWYYYDSGWQLMTTETLAYTDLFYKLAFKLESGLATYNGESLRIAWCDIGHTDFSTERA